MSDLRAALARALPYWRDGNEDTCLRDADTMIEREPRLGLRVICGMVSASGRFGELLACAHAPAHDGDHSWASLPTFVQGATPEPPAWPSYLLNDERLGDALHAAVHSGHPWSGCSNPDAVYERWLPRFRVALNASEPATPRRIDPQTIHAAIEAIGSTEGLDCCDPKTLEHASQSVAALIAEDAT